ncbi:MAG: hypothetical protein AMK71_00350 [Nitrospira bacterium SG8_35_4]|nr:MAG: hypothetical protein AMK71_00350 [Nitrospira bacterium SG8_35_4]
MKSIICSILNGLGVDRLFRLLNKKKLLVVMYHGVSRTNYDPIWTQLPERIFSEHMEYLAASYKVVSLSRLISCIRQERPLPERAALITFDDGLRNNYSVAFPVLKKFSIPATIFLTADFIGTNKILWFDELFFLIQKAFEEGYSLKDIGFMKNASFDDKNMRDNYYLAVEEMKRMSENARNNSMNLIRTKVDIKTELLLEDFGILTQEQIVEMDRSGLVEFGLHTATHQILSTIPQDRWKTELKEPRAQLSAMIGKDTPGFCYPNGRPETDFNDSHVAYLKECGYSCAFTTESVLYPLEGDPFRIGRIPAGNDITSDIGFFRLSTSGAINSFKKIKKKMATLGLDNGKKI